MDEFGALALREREVRRIARRQWFWLHFVVWATIESFFFVIWTLDRKYHYPWFIFPLFIWGAVLAAHAAFVRDPEEIILERVRRLNARGGRSVVRGQGECGRSATVRAAEPEVGWAQEKCGSPERSRCSTTTTRRCSRS
jgi:hypothetical protein